jgi:hypothetical protein
MTPTPLAPAAIAFAQSNLRKFLMPIFLGLNAMLLAACGGGDSDQSTATVPPTVAITLPNASVITKDNVQISVAVTGSPTTVLLLKDTAVLATLTAPNYTYTWNTSAEPERAYQITAKAIKAGTADVVSAARQITLDRTPPVVLSRLPASGAVNVSVTSEISITFNEPLLASSVNAQSARLLVAGSAVASSAALDTAGTKLRLAFATQPALPALVTVALAGLTDLAGNTVTIADASFTMPAASSPTTSTPTAAIELIVPSLTFSSAAPQGTDTQWNFKVNLNNLSVGHNSSNVKLFLDGKDTAASASDDQSAACRAVANRICYDLPFAGFDSFYNGNHTFTAKVTLANSVVLESSPTSVTINIPNLATSWVREAGSTGSLTTTMVPAAYQAVSLFASPAYSGFFSQQTASGTPGSYQSSYLMTVALAGGFVSGLNAPFFRAVTTSPAGSLDTVIIRIRSCSPATCSVWNAQTSFLGSDTIKVSPPFIANIDRLEIQLTYRSSQPDSTVLIGNVFVGR